MMHFLERKVCYNIKVGTYLKHFSYKFLKLKTCSSSTSVGCLGPGGSGTYPWLASAMEKWV